jgi:hypothetical protein
MGHPLFPEWRNAEFDKDTALHIIRDYGLFVADHEALRLPPPVSRIRNPDGSEQPETQHEYVSRVVENTVLYLLEMGLLVIPDDIEQRGEQYFPLQRMP